MDITDNSELGQTNAGRSGPHVARAAATTSENEVDGTTRGRAAGGEGERTR